MNPQASSGEHPKQEPSDLHPRAILVGGVSVILMVVLVALIAYLLTRVSGATGAVPAHAPIAPSPRLSSSPEDDRAAFEREKRVRLETYGWADSKHVFAHIPIEQAMQRLATQDSSSRRQRLSYSTPRLNEDPAGPRQESR